MMYASKALCTLSTSAIIASEGFGFDVVSAGEIYTVHKAGADMSKVLFNGNNKSSRELELAIDLKVGRISVDNFYEAELLNKIAQEKGVIVDVLLRVTPAIECHTHEYIKTGQLDSKFGFDLSQVDDVISLNYPSLNIKGLHAIYIEPGRSIISTSGVTLYTVGSSKQVPNGRKYVAVDGGMADNPRPAMYKAKYSAEVANKTNAQEKEDVTIAGRFCESGDILIENITLPKLEAGDILCVYNTGAYNYSMASNYNRVEKPAMVLVNNSQSDMIVNRESLEDLVYKENIPDRLRR